MQKNKVVFIAIILIAYFSCIFTTIVKAQTFTEIKKVNKVEKTIKIIVNNIEFNCFVNESNNVYYYRQSKKTKKFYRWYVGYITIHKFKNLSIYSNADNTKFWYIILNSNKHFKKVYLNKN